MQVCYTKSIYLSINTLGYSNNRHTVNTYTEIETNASLTIETVIGCLL